MASGFKVRKLVTVREYTIEELYEAIKDKQFTAGHPVLTKRGMTMIIAFPSQDRNNQIWVSPGQMKKAPYSKFTVAKNEIAGKEDPAKNAAEGAVAEGWSRMSPAIGNTVSTAEELVVTTYEELQKLGL